MSRTRIITLVCWLVVAVVMIGLIVWVLTGSIFGLRTGLHITPPFSGFSISSLTGPYDEVGSYSVPADGVDSLDVGWTAGAVTVTPYDGKDIKITEFAQRELEEREKLVHSVKGGTLKIDYIAPGNFLNMITKKLEVLVPAELAEDFRLLEIDATSADVTVSDFSVTTLDIDETSGTTDIGNIQSDTVNVGSTSGTIDIRDTTAAELNAGSVSGDIRLTGVTADTLVTSTTSGSNALAGTFISIDAGSVSGEVRITSDTDPDRITCGTTSGSIVVSIPGDTDPSVHYSSVSGHFSSEIPVRTSDGNAPYSFTSVSGSITLKAA